MAYSIRDYRNSVRKQLDETKYLIASYPVAMYLLFFAVPLGMIFVYSFYITPDNGYFAPGFTLEHYHRFFSEGLYTNRLIFTIQLALVVTMFSLVLGYPLAYYLATMDRPVLRRIMMITIMSSLWVTYVIRAYAWSVILSRQGIVSRIGVTVGLISEPTSFTPGYWSLVSGMVYVLLPFMVLILYTSVKNIDQNLLAASKNLGAGPLQTFRKVTFPLSKNGVISGSVLVFILAIGSYILPKMLGKPSHWTLPVFIGDQVNLESNVPFAAAMSVILVVTVIVLLWLTTKLTDVDAASLGGAK